MAGRSIQLIARVADNAPGGYSVPSLYDGSRPDLDEAHVDQLFERLRDGDERAAELLYLQYYPRLLRFAFGYVHSRAVAEEIVQDVFLSLWERRSTLNIQSSVNGYLYAAVRNRARRFATREPIALAVERNVGLFGVSVGVCPRPHLGDWNVEDDTIAGRIARAVRDLGETSRLALTLRWRHQLSYADIAQVMNMTVGAAIEHVTYARHEVARFIEDAPHA